MRRKVSKIGASTLMVSLPSKWCKANQLKKGDEVEIDVEKNFISISKDGKEKKEKEINSDISNFSKYLLSRYLESLYLSGYSKITLTYSNQEVFSDKEQKRINLKSVIKNLTNRFIGMEIVSQSRNRTELHCFLLDEEKDLNKIEKRIFFLLKDIVSEFFQSLNNHEEFHKSIYDHHDSITKFITYYLRALDQSEKNEEEKKQLYSLYMIIDKLLDKFRHLNEMVCKYGCSNKVKKHLEEIFDLLFEQFSALHKSNLPPELVTKRYNLVRKIENHKYSLNEVKVINEVKIFLDTINDFSRAIIIKQLSEKDH